ncbi:MAG: enoyl-CoA hydratase/isomerase family protein [Syntrophomonadaceae bacterium]|jgi:enoyl-CoA hydratase|nr:enoyl-CoA hydratase/isomerase family protein [Syntrophomonadaceae bacterium]
MDFKTIALSIDQGIATLLLNSPQTMNALSSELMGELGTAVNMVKNNKQVRVLLISGSQKVFAAGGDIKAMAECNPEQARAYIEPIHQVFDDMASLPQASIAAISGFAFGGGVELSLACDFRIAAENAKFGFPEINLGIFPAAGGSQRLPRLIGVQGCKRLMFTGETINAATAIALGLVDQVVPTEQLMEEAKQLALKLSQKPPLALMKLKESIQQGINTDLATAMKMEMDKCCSLFATRDQKEGMQAFMERREAIFKGE